MNPPLLVLALCLLATAGLAQTTEPGEAKVAVGADTTILTKPQRDDGTVDYIAALNARLGKDISATNNAAVVLLRMSGTRALGTTRPKVLAALKVEESIPERGTWQSWPGFFFGREETAEAVARFGKLRLQPWSAEKEPAVAAWLTDNDEALGQLLEATARPRFWMPLVADADHPTLLSAHAPPLIAWKEAGEALLTRAMLKAHEGDMAGAWKDLHGAHRLAALLGQDSRLITALVGASLTGLSCQADETLLMVRPHTVELLRTMQKDLAALPDPPDPREVYGRMERYQFHDEVQQIAQKDAAVWAKHLGLKEEAGVDAALEKAGLPRLDYNQILRLGTRYFDELLRSPAGLTPPQAAARAAYLQAMDKAFRRVSEEREAINKAAGDDEDAWLYPQKGETRKAYSERVGTGLLAMMVPDLPRVIQRRDRVARRLTATRVLCALELYRAEKGTYPEKLAALVPACVAAVPTATADYPLTYEATAKGFKFSWVRSEAKRKDGYTSAFDDIVLEVPR